MSKPASKALPANEAPLEHVSPIKLVQPEAKWMAIVKHELGVHEKPGTPNEPRILEYIKSVPQGLPLDDEDTAWCSCFANWVFLQCGMKRTKNALAKSWLHWGVKLDQPRYGCIVVFWRGTPSAATGHVAFYTGDAGSRIKHIGGNQSNSVCESYTDKARVLGYFWPTDA